MFKTIDSLLEFTNETEFKRLWPKMQQIRKLDKSEREGEWQSGMSVCERERKDEESQHLCWWIVSRTMAWKKIDATNNKIPVNLSERERETCVYVFFARKKSAWKWSMLHTHCFSKRFGILKPSLACVCIAASLFESKTERNREKKYLK